MSPLKKSVEVLVSSLPCWKCWLVDTDRGTSGTSAHAQSRKYLIIKRASDFPLKPTDVILGLAWFSPPMGPLRSAHYSADDVEWETWLNNSRGIDGLIACSPFQRPPCLSERRNSKQWGAQRALPELTQRTRVGARLLCQILAVEL